MSRRKVAIAIALVLIIAVSVFIFLRSGKSPTANRVVGSSAGTRAASGATGTQPGNNSSGSDKSANGNMDKILQTGAVPEASVGHAERSTDDDTTRAINLLRDQRSKWCAIRSVSARYKVTTTCKFPSRPSANYQQEGSGSVELLVMPYDKAGNAPPVIRVRLTNDELGVTYVLPDLYDMQAQPQWAKSQDAGDKSPTDEQINKGVLLMRDHLQNWFQPLTRMERSYLDRIDGTTSISDRILLPPVYERASSAEETARLFANTPHYLMNLDALPDHAWWFNRDTGELGRFGGTKSFNDGVTLNWELGNYLKSQDGKAAFPTRLTRFLQQSETRQKDPGATVVSTVDLSGVEINQPIATSDFRLQQ